VRPRPETSPTSKPPSATPRAVTPQDALGWFTACGYSFI
jgi:hypothetical protein